MHQPDQPSLTELARYHRQMLLPGIAEHGQRALLAAHVAIVGVGALGCHAADMLCRAGVGRITLIDRDIVELTNLQRQTLFTTLDARSGLPKVEAATLRLREVNPDVTIRPLAVDLTPANALDALSLGNASDFPRPSIIIDGTDNFETRYLLNDIVVAHNLALSYGGVVGTRGMSMLLTPHGQTPCLRCIFPEPPEPGSSATCDTAGVLGPAVAIVAAMQTAEVLKLLVGEGSKLAQSLSEFDLWTNQRRRFTLDRAADCPCCVHKRFVFLQGARTSQPSALCGQDAVQIGALHNTLSLDLASLAARLSAHGDIKQSKLMLRFTPHTLLHDSQIRLTIFADARVIVHGTTRHDVARSLYAKYIGA